MEVNWEFEAKDHNTDKYGNFSTYSLIKLVSKYNKSTISMHNQADAAKIAEVLSEELNKRLADESVGHNIINQEIK